MRFRSRVDMRLAEFEYRLKRLEALFQGVTGDGEEMRLRGFFHDVAKGRARLMYTSDWELFNSLVTTVKPPVKCRECGRDYEGRI